METAQTLSSQQGERPWAVGVHAGALLLAFMTSWSAGVAGMLVALAVYCLKRNDSAFVAEHAREAFNFNLTMFLLACAVVVAGLLLVGATVLTLGIGVIVTLPIGLLLVVLALAVAVSWLVCSVIATIKAWQGEAYRYPFSLRLL